MIHGRAASIRCITLGDEAAEDLSVLVAKVDLEKIKLLLAPWDLRRKLASIINSTIPSWMQARYRRLQTEMNSCQSPVLSISRQNNFFTILLHCPDNLF